MTDIEISELIQEPKILPDALRRCLSPVSKRGHAEASVELVGDRGNAFRLVIRKSLTNSFDFSVILIFLDLATGKAVRLRRYNGLSHEHTNPIERETFYAYHIHTATERYMRSGSREDTYAEKTSRYSTLNQALECLLVDCGVYGKDQEQTELFRDV